MSQSKTHSWLEACANTATGFLISYAASVIGYHAMGVQVSAAQNGAVVGFLTVVSIVRSYVWRRIFNRKQP